MQQAGEVNRVQVAAATRSSAHPSDNILFHLQDTLKHWHYVKIFPVNSYTVWLTVFIKYIMHASESIYIARNNLGSFGKVRNLDY